MPAPLFYLFAILMLAGGIGVILNRNPVASALSLVVSFIGLAAIYISLNAYFIGTIQILVYAGAVMVLFLFIIMLLDIKAETRRRFNLPAVLGGILLVIGFVAQIGAVLGEFKPAKTKLEDFPITETSDVKQIGETLFTHYHFHLQVIGVLLLVATVGVVVLSRREDKPAEPKS
ncbi:MAG: NADH-quinone oxidoreductase subunit J [Verrucomicrobiales bacterium]|nr:NADH-quinone oxidoreductase subunit J [Verrucomicrobiales bacterium]